MVVLAFGVIKNNNNNNRIGRILRTIRQKHMEKWLFVFEGQRRIKEDDKEDEERDRQYEQDVGRRYNRYNQVAERAQFAERLVRRRHLRDFLGVILNILESEERRC